MRVELVYAPGCNTYRKALAVLESVIAEEGLPIPIEMSEELPDGEPVIRIHSYNLEATNHPFDGDSCFLSGQSLGISEQLRSLLSQKWTEHAVPI